MTAKQLKEIGIQLSLFGAGDDWNTEAYKHFENFLKSNNIPFMVEDVREYAYLNGLQEATNKRAWGGIVLKLKHQGLIRHIGYAQVKNPNAHMANASVWVKI